MKQKLLLLLAISCVHHKVKSQATDTTGTNQVMYFVSDTQQPMLVERLWLKSNHNIKATAGIFASILKEKPNSLYMLGDVVGLGASNRKWKKVDIFLDSCRRGGTTVCGILGNHEVMGLAKKGEANFQKRFPMNVSTGYVSITDSVAVVLLNSNFTKLTAEENEQQKQWYNSTMASLDTSTAVRAVIVCCHHAPYTNSKIVKCCSKVQDYFVAAYIKSKKAQLFITGHAHAFEHFKMMGKDFLVIGGGGGLHQPLNEKEKCLPDLAIGYKPPFHYLSVRRINEKLIAASHSINDDFSNFSTAYNFSTNNPEADNMAKAGNASVDELKKN
ncbi:MAG: metallophosphoesterase [Chitinophagaceae bacterium]|nr:metallophosphoesterase [Chitinophagaceae bacterium]